MSVSESTQPSPFLSPSSGGTELYLIRHADALPDAAEVVEGGYNEQALSPLGRKQAEALAAGMRGLTLTAVYSSPIPRAAQTAQPLAETQGLEVRLDDGLREVALGPMDAGLGPDVTPEQRAAAIRDGLHELARMVVTTGVWTGVPGTESSRSLRGRMTETVDRIAAAHPGQRVALVSHGGSINAYIAAFLGIERDYFFPAANTSVSVVRWHGARRLLMGLNDISHLRQAGLM